MAILQKERDILQDLNNYRNGKGKKNLSYDDTASVLARVHSNNMANGSIPFSHQGMDQRIDTLKKHYKIERASENCYMDSGKGLAGLNLMKPVNLWMDSSGHNKNMLGDFTHVGIGIAQNEKASYCTALFSKHI